VAIAFVSHLMAAATHQVTWEQFEEVSEP
jgi:hypothetical protein